MDDIINILPKLFQSKHEFANHDIYRKFVLNLLLNKLITFQTDNRFNTNQRRILNETLLKLNLTDSVNKTNDSENIYQILRLGASLTYSERKGKTVVEQLDYDILKTHFEDCIDNDIFYYDSIVEDEEYSYSETKTLTYLANDNKKKNLLTQPVLTVFIHEKWSKIKMLFYINVLVYLLYVICIYGYVISRLSGREYHWFDGLFYGGLCFHSAKELIQLTLYRWKYFCDPSNYIEILVIFFCYGCIFSPNAYFTTLVILFSTVILFLFLIQVPKFTKFTFILGSLKYFFQYACFYFIPFLSFAIGLNTLFPHPDKTDTIKSDNYLGELSRHLFETLILFTGEFNDRVLQPEHYPVFGRVFMTVFILCMTIVLNNLLVGLIVSDMDRIEKESRIYKCIKMANFIIRVNAAIKQFRKFRNISFIEKLINQVHIFHKGPTKKIFLDDATKEHFDDRNREDLEKLETLKWTLYDENVLKKVHEEIYKDDED